ncbi:MAG: HDIG domain-containing metalloprotein, partial [Candidatus Omnitrophota bacterium]
PVFFTIDDAVEDSAVENVGIFFDGLDGINAIADPAGRKAAVEKLRTDSGINIPEGTVLYFAEREDRESVRASVIDILTNIFPLGVIGNEAPGLNLNEITFVKIVDSRVGTERVRPVNDVLKVDGARAVADEYASRFFPRDRKLKTNSAELISCLISPNLVFDAQETKKEREKSVADMTPVYNTVEVKKNEQILERGTRITGRHIQQLMQLGIAGDAAKRRPYFWGMLLIIVILLLTGGLWLYMIDKRILTLPKDISVILINCLFVILVGQFVIQSPQVNYVIPLSGMSMLIALLLIPRTAIAPTMLVSMFLGILAGGKLDVVVVLAVSGFAGLYLVKGARRRSTIILAGIGSGLAAGVAVIAMGLLNNVPRDTYLMEACWGAGSGILSIFIVMGALPLFEYGFKMTTDITLLELSDLNNPLLKELTLKAPGTYQHSMMVGNLAEAACEAIGANSLLARVGSYYHDIGKIGKAEYFSENEMGAMSKHEKLMPSMSALIIVNHVKDGVELAKKYKLNPKMIEFIEQHHGTSLIYYFYRRALEKGESEHELNEEEFRYPGPKPRSKEAAIVLLADSVEASSRALSDPTPSRIKGIVQKIMNNKFIDNQLDNCDLTLKDLNKIAESFVRILTAVFHTRLEYPDPKDVQAKKNGKNKNKA